MTTTEEWADQYRAECEKQASTRAAILEPLLRAGDYEACRDWLTEWECEDRHPASLRQQYRQTLNTLRSQRYQLSRPQH